jgi:hypothetical protein
LAPVSGADWPIVIELAVTPFCANAPPAAQAAKRTQASLVIEIIFIPPEKPGIQAVVMMRQGRAERVADNYLSHA